MTQEREDVHLVHRAGELVLGNPQIGGKVLQGRLVQVRILLGLDQLDKPGAELDDVWRYTRRVARGGSATTTPG